MLISRSRSKTIVLLFAAALLLVGFAVTTIVTIHAQQTCSEDLQGPNDEPGQKDITYACIDSSEWPNKLYVTWQWDEIGWSGANTGDNCMTFDSNTNGTADYALCVSVSGTPAQLQSGPNLYSCNDTLRVNCAGSQLIPGPYQTNCTVEVLPTDPVNDPPVDPFPEGADYPQDTVANCEIYLDDFGSNTPLVVIDDCSYPSSIPNSDPSDCILTPTNPNVLTLTEPVGAGGSIAIPLVLPVAVVGIVGLITVALFVWIRKEN